MFLVDLKRSLLLGDHLLHAAHLQGICMVILLESADKQGKACLDPPDGFGLFEKCFEVVLGSA